jgi:carboxyl-terminal processing protease
MGEMDDMTDETPMTDERARPPVGAGDPPHGPGPGLILAGVLALIVVFAAGLAIGQGLGGGAPAVTPTSAAVATPSVTPPLTPSPTTAAETGTSTTSPTGSPATASPAPSPAPAEATGTPAPTIPLPSQPPGAPTDFALFWEALGLVRERYVDRADITDTDLTYGAIRGLVDALGDAGHSVFLTPDQLAAERESLQGRVSGIGAILGERAGRPIIVSVISGAPADRAGLRPGDLILAVDGRSIDRLRTDEVVELVRGRAGTEVMLSIQHRGEVEVLDVTMVREVIDVPAVSWSTVPGTTIADIRLVSFSEGAGEALHEALQAALDAGAQRIVLDLRSNPGGLVNEAVAVASDFLASGVVYQRQDAAGETAPVEVSGGGIATEVPLVVIVDEGTASSAEIVAGAIQDNGRGRVIGKRTFGTGTVLNTFELSDGSAVRLGVEHWLTPDGRLIFDSGIEPDEVVELPSDGLTLEPRELEGMTPEDLAAASDTQLLRAIEILVTGGDVGQRASRSEAWVGIAR